MGRLLLLYVLLLLYGSWYPFAWSEPAAPLLAFLHAGWPAHLDKGDIVQNLLVYMPFGLLAVAWRQQARAARPGRGRRPGPPGAPRTPPAGLAPLLLAAAGGCALSFAIEFGQQYLPARVPSLLDVAMNGAGTVAGALLGALVHGGPGSGVLAVRDAWCRPGPLASTGLVAVGLWFLSQTSPLVPSLDLAQLRHALGYLFRSLADPLGADVGKLATLLCYQAGLGILLASVLRPGRSLLQGYCVLVGFTCLCKLLVAGRVLSLEMLAAAALALPVLVLARSLPPRLLAGSGIVALAAGMVIYELLPGPPVAAPYAWGFNWVPFAGQMENLSGLQNILEFLWPAMAMACLLRQVLPYHRQDAGAVVGTVLVAAGMFLLEWVQQSVPGRYGDITQVLLACAGWIVPWCVPGRVALPAAAALKQAPQAAGRR